MASKLTNIYVITGALASALLFAGVAGEAIEKADAAADSAVVAPSVAEAVAEVESVPSAQEQTDSGDSENKEDPSAEVTAAAESEETPPVEEQTAATEETAVPPPAVPAPAPFADEPPPAVASERQVRTIVVPSSEAKTINAAMIKARPGDTVKVRNGVYRESVLIAPGVTLVAENMFKAVLDGRGRNTIVTMSNNSTIDGFEIRRGTIGVFSTSAGATIKRNRIMHNVQSGVMCIGTLPKMEDNFIVFNRGSGIQGWDVRTTSGSINHNTIAYNVNHGIALGGVTSITVENNIIAFNDQFGVKPGEETVRVELINNNFFRNARISSNLPSDNISADPMFIDPKRFNFNLTNGSASIGMGTDNQNLGARILH